MAEHVSYRHFAKEAQGCWVYLFFAKNEPNHANAKGRAYNPWLLWSNPNDRRKHGLPRRPRSLGG